MTELVIRKSGGANIVSLPKAVLKTLGLHTDSRLHLSLEDNKIILSPVEEAVTLESLLEDSPKEHLKKLPEDEAWMSEKPKGKEEF